MESKGGGGLLLGLHEILSVKRKLVQFSPGQSASAIDSHVCCMKEGIVIHDG